MFGLQHGRTPQGLKALAPVLALGLALGLSSVAATAQSLKAPPPRNGDYIVAVVNTELVTAAEIDLAMQRWLEDADRAGQQPPPLPELRQKVTEALIDERVLIAHSKEFSAKVEDADVDRAVAASAAQNKLSLSQFQQAVMEAGLDIKAYREQLRQQMLLDRLRDSQVRRNVVITETDIDEYLDKQTEQARAKARIHLAQILITVPEKASASEVAQRRARALDVLQRLKSGESFETLARSQSDDPLTAPEGGHLGLRPADRLPDLFIQATRNLAPGSVSPEPLRSSAGFHVLKVIEREEVSPLLITQTRVRHILLRPTDAKGQAEALARLQDFRRDIASGTQTFEALAKAHSEDGSAPQGGDLGWASPGLMVPEFEEAMNQLPLGGVSEPVASRFGLHLIQVLERRQNTLEPRQVRERARNALREARYPQAYEKWVKDLRARAYIEMREAPQ
jgi:peptidyl-prolyl cis-trans isomerase SurA